MQLGCYEMLQVCNEISECRHIMCLIRWSKSPLPLSFPKWIHILSIVDQNSFPLFWLQPSQSRSNEIDFYRDEKRLECSELLPISEKMLNWQSFEESNSDLSCCALQLLHHHWLPWICSCLSLVWMRTARAFLCWMWLCWSGLCSLKWLMAAGSPFIFSIRQSRILWHSRHDM